MEYCLSKLQIPEENLEELRCFSCKEYLSQFPIYSYPGTGNLCGRCPLPDDKHLERNKAYETLAEIILFPCRYTSFGCTETQTPVKLHQHEESCSYRQYECILLPKGCCAWKGPDDQFLEHFQSEHPQFILNEEGFKLDFENEVEQNYLFGKFVVKLISYIQKKSIRISVAMLGMNDEYEEYRYRLKLESNEPVKKEYLFEAQKINAVRSDSSSQISSAIDIKSAFVQETLHNNIDIVCKVLVSSYEDIPDSLMKGTQTSLPTKDINEFIYEAIKGSICCEFLKPPIYVCLSASYEEFRNRRWNRKTYEYTETVTCDHFKEKIVCETCKCSVKYCSDCGHIVTLDYISVRPLTMVAEKLTYNCENREYGCPSYTDINNVKAHRTECQFKPRSCSIVDSYPICSWKGLPINFGKHIEEKHQKIVLTSGTVIIPTKTDRKFLCKSYGISFLLSVYGKTYYKSLETMITWSVELLDKEQNEINYFCIIDFVDTKSKGNRLYFKIPCNASPFKIGSEFVESMCDDQLVFRIRITKD